MRPLLLLDVDGPLNPQHGPALLSLAERAFLAKRRANGTPTLLARVAPQAGLTAADMDSVEIWLGSL